MSLILTVVKLFKIFRIPSCNVCVVDYQKQINGRFEKRKGEPRDDHQSNEIRKSGHHPNKSIQKFNQSESVREHHKNADRKGKAKDEPADQTRRRSLSFRDARGNEFVVESANGRDVRLHDEKRLPEQDIEAVNDRFQGNKEILKRL